MIEENNRMSNDALFFAGVDIGSNTAKAVILEDNKIIGHSIATTGIDIEKVGRTVIREALETAGISGDKLSYTVATGYGRITASYANEIITEITCHAKGAHYFFPSARAVIDIGGQDSKGIKLDENGNVVDFIMNDKCAAGTGRFLEVIARVLEVPINELGSQFLAGEYACPINSTCAIFAESEVISLLAGGEKRENIIKGLHFASAKRVSSLYSRIGNNGGGIVFAGGVARNIGFRTALEEVLGVKLLLPQDPQLNGAVGAAVLARDSKLEETE